MSNWTYINGWIELSGIKKQGIIESHKLRKNISEQKYDEYINNYKNFNYKLVDYMDTKRLIINYEKEVKELLKKIETPSGSEGGTEYCLGTYPNCFKLWGFVSSEGTRDWDKKQERLVSERFEEEHNEKDLQFIFETSYGDYSKVFLYGALRDREYAGTKEELIEYINNLKKYFYINDLDITIGFDCECESRCTLNYDDNWKDYLNFDVIDRTFTYKKRLFKDEFKEKCKIKKYTETIYLDEE